MPIQWREAMRIGHPAIDADHQRLIEILNLFEESVANGSKPQVMGDILTGLLRYTEHHFEREEKVQKQVRYPFHDGHVQAHRELLKQVTAYRVRWDTQDDVGKVAMTGELAAFLKGWLVNHILEQDLRMKPFVAPLFTAEGAAG